MPKKKSPNIDIYFSSVSAAVDLIPKILFEMLSAAKINSLTKALVEQHAVEINAVDVMRYSAQKIILIIRVH